MIGIISISKQGNALSAKLARLLGNTTCYTLEKWSLQDFIPIKGKLKDFCGQIFHNHESLIFIMASGIAVRSIAPWVIDKKTDPAVIVIDDKGKNVISLMSGHLGGANILTNQIAIKIGAHSVITTATDINNLPAVDMMAKSKNLEIDSMEAAKSITAMIVNRERVELIDNYGIFSKSIMPVVGGDCKGRIIISNNKQLNETKPFVKLIPRNIILGIGCKKNTKPSNLLNFITETIERFNIDERSIKIIASIFLKKDEKAILEAADKINCQLKFFSTEELQKVDNLFKGSSFVMSTVGVASVSTTAAYVAGDRSGVFITKKEIMNGMTISIFEQK